MLGNQKPPGRCPRCGCLRIARNGRRANGTSKWKCGNPDCPKPYFDDWTGTCFSSCKLPDEKIRLLLSMTFEDCLEEQICNVAGLSSRTVYVWRMKIYDVASRFVSGIEAFRESLVRRDLRFGQRLSAHPPRRQEAQGHIEEPGGDMRGDRRVGKQVRRSRGQGASQRREMP